MTKSPPTFRHVTINRPRARIISPLCLESRRSYDANGYSSLSAHFFCFVLVRFSIPRNWTILPINA